MSILGVKIVDISTSLEERDNVRLKRQRRMNDDCAVSDENDRDAIRDKIKSLKAKLRHLEASYGSIDIEDSNSDSTTVFDCESWSSLSPIKGADKQDGDEASFAEGDVTTDLLAAFEREEERSSSSLQKSSSIMRRMVSIFPITRKISELLFCDAEMKATCEADTFALMMFSKPCSKEWLLGFVSFAIQVTMTYFVFVEQYLLLAVANFSCNCPEVMITGQIFTVLLSTIMHTDALEAIRVFTILTRRESNWGSLLIGEEDSESCFFWSQRVFFPNFLKVVEGTLVWAVSILLIVQSADIFELLFNFTAMMIVSKTGAILYSLAANGFLGTGLQKSSLECQEVEIRNFHEGDTTSICFQMTLILCVLVSLSIPGYLCVSWILALSKS